MIQEDSVARDIRVGTLSAIGAFSMWGVLPLYWIQISAVPALEVLWHRVFWGAVVAWIIVFYRRRRQVRTALVARAAAPESALAPSVLESAPTPETAPTTAPTVATTTQARGLPPLVPRGRVLAWLLLNGVLVVTNWFVYIWAVSSGRTLDASLGYYINPLVSVLLGMVFFGDRLTRLQWAAVASATAGVLFLTIRLGVFPWVSLVLAGTFGTYGLIKKRTALSSIHSLAVELTPLSVVAAVAIGLGIAGGSGVPAHGDWRAAAFLLGAGIVTVAPLLLFGVAAQRIRLSDVGFLQYIAPTLMFLIALTIFDDPLEPARLVGFILVWIGLAMYTYSNYRSRRARRREAHRHDAQSRAADRRAAGLR